MGSGVELENPSFGLIITPSVGVKLLRTCLEQLRAAGIELRIQRLSQSSERMGELDISHDDINIQANNLL